LSFLKVALYNRLMLRLRNALHLARFVLVWFALSVGVAIASPMVNPKGVDMVCSSAGAMKLVVQGDDDGVASSLTMDCPLCAGIGAPPTEFNTSLTQPSPLFFGLRPIEVARIASATAPPLPSRGPPTSIR